MVIQLTDSQPTENQTAIIFNSETIGTGRGSAKVDLESGEARIYLHLLTNGARRCITAVINREEPPPALFNPSIGRTINLPLINGDKRDFSRIVKIKGAALLSAGEPEIIEQVERDTDLKQRCDKTCPELWHLRQIEPNTIYLPAVPHLGLGKDLNINIVHSRPKTLGTLSLEAAQAEFNCHLKLQRTGIATKPVFAAPLINPATNEVIRDINNYQIGVSVTELKPNYVTADHFLDYYVTDEGIIYRSKRLKGTTQISPYKLLKDETFALFCKMAYVKRQAILETGLSKHAGHCGNFSVHESTPLRCDAYITDLDSCSLIEDSKDPLKGSAAVRDIAKDLWRTAYTLTMHCMSKNFFPMMEQLKPFSKLLSIYFGGVSDTYFNESVKEFGEFLDQKYMEIVELNFTPLKNVTSEVRRFIREGEIGDDYSYLNEYCANLHDNFLKFTIYTCAHLANMSPVFKAKGCDVRVPNDNDSFLRGINQGIDNYRIITNSVYNFEPNKSGILTAYYFIAQN